MMYLDKKRAVRNASKSGKGRIPEATLLKVSFLLGFAGIGLGMFLFRHKINNMNFRFGVPFFALINIGLYFLFKQKLIDYFDCQFYFDVAIVETIIDFMKNDG